jgi:hypothetical protein
MPPTQRVSHDGQQLRFPCPDGFVFVHGEGNLIRKIPLVGVGLHEMGLCFTLGCAICVRLLLPFHACSDHTD